MLKSWLLQEKLFFYTPTPPLSCTLGDRKQHQKVFCRMFPVGPCFGTNMLLFPEEKTNYSGALWFFLFCDILIYVYQLDKSYLGHLWIWIHAILTGHWLMYRVGFDLQLKAYLRHQYSLLFGFNKIKIHRWKFSRKTRHNFLPSRKDNLRGNISWPKGNISTWLWISEEKCNNWLKL